MAGTDRRRGLRPLLLSATVLVAVASIGATAWLSVQTATGTIRTEQIGTQAKLRDVYETLVGYGATHSKWDDIRPLMAQLSTRTGLHMAVTSENRLPVAGPFDSDGLLLSSQPTAVIDPRALDVNFSPDAPVDRIDRRAVGPYRLTVDEQAALRKVADDVVACQRSSGQSDRSEIVINGAGRSYVVPAPEGGCAQSTVMRTERTALDELNRLLGECLRARGLPEQQAALTQDGGFRAADTPVDQQVFADCLGVARRAQLAAYVAPPLLLFVQDTSGRSQFSLSSAGTTRIALAALLVLVLTVGVSALLARGVLRPLRSLTETVRRMRGGEGAVRADVKARWEVAELAGAFNEMADHLARTEQLRKDLVGDVSHELRTPVTTIRGWLVAAQDGVVELDPTLVDSLLEETLVLQQLVDDLQELAFADAGELRLRPAVVDLGEVLAQIAAVQAMPVVVEATGDLRTTADPVRIRQAIQNLVNNARQHTSRDGAISLRGRVDGDFLVVSVSDTGSGISEEDLPHVFDRFWRADRSRNRRTGGRGLGLAIVKHYVEAHGGTITVHSELGRGATFTIRLPRERGFVVT